MSANSPLGLLPSQRGSTPLRATKNHIRLIVGLFFRPADEHLGKMKLSRFSGAAAYFLR